MSWLCFEFQYDSNCDDNSMNRGWMILRCAAPIFDGKCAHEVEIVCGERFSIDSVCKKLKDKHETSLKLQRASLMEWKLQMKRHIHVGNDSRLYHDSKTEKHGNAMVLLVLYSYMANSIWGRIRKDAQIRCAWLQIKETITCTNTWSHYIFFARNVLEHKQKSSFLWQELKDSEKGSFFCKKTHWFLTLVAQHMSRNKNIPFNSV